MDAKATELALAVSDGCLSELSEWSSKGSKLPNRWIDFGAACSVVCRVFPKNLVHHHRTAMNTKSILSIFAVTHCASTVSRRPPSPPSERGEDRGEVGVPLLSAHPERGRLVHALRGWLRKGCPRPGSRRLRATSPGGENGRFLKLSCCVFLCLFAANFCGFSQGTAFTYQGRLAQNEINATGVYDLRFAIYDFEVGGNLIAGPLQLSSVRVNNGLFAATLDFGANVFNGNPLWLEVGVRTNGSLAVHQRLLPRQPITATPYAIQASGISGTLPDAQLSANVPRLNSSNHFAGPVTFGPASGSPFAISGSSSNKVIRGLNADQVDGFDSSAFWKLGGNAGTSNGIHFLGTTDNRPLELRASGVGVGTSNPRDKAHVEGGSLRITGSGPVYDPGANGLRLGGGPAGQPGFSWIQSWDGPLALNPYANAVGIGTTNPEATLHVEGNAYVNSNLDISPNGNSDGQLKVRGNGYTSYLALDAVGMHFGHNSSSRVLAFEVDEVERLRIDTAGNVGIGTTTPRVKLHVVGDQTYIQGTGGLAALDVNQGGTGAAALFRGGKVGIGTTSPAEQLEVVGSMSLSGGNRRVLFHDDGNYDFSIDHNGGSSLDIRSPELGAGITIASFMNNGHVGIGTALPAERLHVVGNVAVSAPNQFIAKYQNEDNAFAASLRWNSLQLGNNGANYIIGGRTVFGGSIIFVTGNTMDFQTPLIPHNGKEVMTLLPDGRIGLGTTTPGAAVEISNIDSNRHSRLDIFKSKGNDSDRASLRIGYDADNSLEIFRTRAEGHINYHSSQLGADQRFTTASGGNFSFTGGNMGVGRQPLRNRLEIEGNASKSVGGSWLANSDARIKHDIKPVDRALSTLDRVRLVSFRYTEDYRKAHPDIEDRSYLNVVAQEFREVFPDDVKGSGEKLPDGHEILQVDTYPLTIYSAAAIQELHQLLKAKDREVQELKDRLSKVEDLEKTVAELKQVIRLLPKNTSIGNKSSP